MSDQDQNNQVIEVLDEQQCQLLLRSRNIGRIAFSIEGVPEIFPVNYAADRSTVVFRDR
ncbi:MAG: pyridoxamine 5'-phosphate oxidase family protein [Chloroflexi bacterium]|nr:MAG: pyridoxamine 5'-phosphate oxidase family protein [Chloroflexota bacterium]